MTQMSESQKETQVPIRALVHPKQELNIGNWNVGTLYQASNSAQVGRGMEQLNIGIIGIFIIKKFKCGNFSTPSLLGVGTFPGGHFWVGTFPGGNLTGWELFRDSR